MSKKVLVKENISKGIGFPQMVSFYTHLSKECYESVDHSAMPLHFKVFFLQNLQDCMGIGGFASGGSEDLGCRPFSRR